MAIQMGQQITTEFDVPARMRDGVTLRANVYRPQGEGRWPVLLTRLPYGKDLPLANALLDPAQVARRGYVVIIQDTRGRFTSEGGWEPMRNEVLDGEDSVAWAAQLPYSNGSVGMYGISYFGFTQWASAVQQPPALKAIIPIETWSDPFNGVFFRGGAMELGTAASWQMMMGMDVLVRRYRSDPDPRNLGRILYSSEGERRPRQRQLLVASSQRVWRIEAQRCSTCILRPYRASNGSELRESNDHSRQA